MKAWILIYMSIFLASIGNGQNVIHSSYDNIQLRSGSNTNFRLNGYQNIQFDTIENKAIFAGSLGTGRTLDNIGINKSGFLYAIEGNFGQQYNIVSCDTKNNFSTHVAKANVSWDGGAGTDARTSGMTVDNNDYGWVVAYSVVNGNNYLTSFETDNAGAAGNLSAPYIVKTDLPSFQISDIAFDRFNNLYALVLDLLKGNQYIYFAHADSFAGAGSGNGIMLLRKWQITNENDSPVLYQPLTSVNPGRIESYIAEGLAFSDNDCLLISVDKITIDPSVDRYSGFVSNNIYALSFTDATQVSVIRSVVGSTFEVSESLSYCSDLASNYFPVFLPLVFGDIAARIQDDEIRIRWSTKSERYNNEFKVELSANGVDFVTVGTLKSQAQDGSSNREAFYNFDIDLNTAFSKIAFVPAYLLLLLGGSGFIKRNRLFPLLLLFLFSLNGCSGNSKKEELSKNSGKVVVRVTATDAKGNLLSSKVVQAIR